MRRWWIGGLLFLSAVGRAAAEAPTLSTGDSYLTHCALPADAPTALVCIAYLRGLNDGLAGWERDTCNPKPYSEHER